MRAVIVILGIAFLVLLVGCRARVAQDEISDYNQEAVLKVSVFQSGTVLVNGRPATLAALDATLTELDNANGVVWYYRENMTDRASAKAMQAFHTIMAHNRPISMSSKPDFSDVIILQTGESEPRR